MLLATGNIGGTPYSSGNGTGALPRLHWEQDPGVPDAGGVIWKTDAR
jgi:hypothetical protein